VLNCLVFFGLIVLVGSRKSLLNVTIVFFLQTFSSSLIVCIYLLVNFISCLFSSFYLLPFVVNKDVYISRDAILLYVVEGVQ